MLYLNYTIHKISFNPSSHEKSLYLSRMNRSKEDLHAEEKFFGHSRNGEWKGEGRESGREDRDRRGEAAVGEA